MTRQLVMSALILAAIVSSRVDAQKIADPLTRREALELFRSGQEFMAAERFDRAAESFAKAIAKDGLLTVAHYGLGQASMSLQRFDEAVKAYKACLEALRTLHNLQETSRFDVDKYREDEIRELRAILNQSSRGARTITMLSLEQRLRDLENQRSSVGSPFRPPAEVLLALGSAYFRQGDREAAEVEWKAAADANPKLGEAHNNLAVIYLQAGRLDDADRELRLAEKSGFRVNPQFKDDLRKLRSKN